MTLQGYKSYHYLSSRLIPYQKYQSLTNNNTIDRLQIIPLLIIKNDTLTKIPILTYNTMTLQGYKSYHYLSLRLIPCQKYQSLTYNNTIDRLRIIPLLIIKIDTLTKISIPYLYQCYCQATNRNIINYQA